MLYYFIPSFLCLSFYLSLFFLYYLLFFVLIFCFRLLLLFFFNYCFFLLFSLSLHLRLDSFSRTSCLCLVLHFYIILSFILIPFRHFSILFFFLFSRRLFLCSVTSASFSFTVFSSPFIYCVISSCDFLSFSFRCYSLSQLTLNKCEILTTSLVYSIKLTRC